MELTDEHQAPTVADLLGREPQGAYEIVVVDDDGAPVVIRNAPLLDDGTPMPTRYWLVGARARTLVGRLEADGGVRRAEREVDAAALADAHARYASERDAALPADHEGPRPHAGVGGTRQGVKCLHAHYAWHLAGGDDPVGRWVADHLDGGEPDAGGAPSKVATWRSGAEPLESEPDAGGAPTKVATWRSGAEPLESEPDAGGAPTKEEPVWR